MRNFAYVNKTYLKDLKYTKALYDSFLKNYLGHSLFYVVCPQVEFEEFKKVLPLVEIIAEEDVILSSNIDLEEFKSLNGYLQQQIIKLVFYKYKNLENYVTLDSDILFIRSFDDDVFFNKNSIKTFAIKGKQSAHGDLINEYYLKYGNVKLLKNFNKILFVCGYAMWSVEMLKKLEEFMAKTDIGNFVRMIKIAPVEMEWYGKFIYLFHRSFIGTIKNERHVNFIHGYIDKKKPHTLKSIELIFMEYYRHLNRSPNNVIGISVHYLTGMRNALTLQDIINTFQHRKPNLFVFMLIQFASHFGVTRSMRYKIKENLLNYYLNY